MAATACAYGYQPQGPRPPGKFVAEDLPVVLKPASPAAPAPPPPAPLPPRPSSKKVPPSFLLPCHLGLCTEGLGSESSGDIDLADEYVVAKDDDVDREGVDADAGHAALPCKRQHRDRGEEPAGRARSGRRSQPAAFPPPISVIGAGGKPWLYLRPHREDGRLVLREVRIPSRELLQARREDGRFKLQFAGPLITQPEDQEPS